MADIELLKRLAEAAYEAAPFPDMKKLGAAHRKFYAKAGPEVVLALIAENERLAGQVQHMIDQTIPLEPVPGDPRWSRRVTIDGLIAERDQIRAELERARATADRAHACFYRWENGHSFDSHGPEREVQRELYEVIRPGALDGIAKLHAAMGKGGGQNGSKAAETRASAGLDGGAEGGKGAGGHSAENQAKTRVNPGSELAGKGGRADG